MDNVIRVHGQFALSLDSEEWLQAAGLAVSNANLEMVKDFVAESLDRGYADVELAHQLREYFLESKKEASPDS
jgi:hypothetical protein